MCSKSGIRRRGLGVNSKAALMKTAWGRPVYVIAFIQPGMGIAAALVVELPGAWLSAARETEPVS
jgi:hypothetical protein